MPVNPTPPRAVVDLLRARFGTTARNPKATVGPDGPGADAEAARAAGSVATTDTTDPNGGAIGGSLSAAAQRVVRPVLDRIGMRAVAAVQPSLDDLRAQLDGVRAELDAVRAELGATRERLEADVELARAELAAATAAAAAPGEAGNG